MKKFNRIQSFIILTAIYLLATVVGIVCYLLLPLASVWLKLLIADVIATVLTFIFSVIFGNASVYDPYWSVQPPVIITVAVFFKGFTNVAAVLAFIAIWVWGIRLTANWAYTFHGLEFQDWRYTMLKEKTGVFYPVINFVGIHLVPTLVVYACTLPAVMLFLAESTSFNVGCIIGLIISLLAVLLECTADVQMQSFRKSGLKGFIRVGVWKYSRHPNYLGEISMWWGVGILCFSALIHSSLAWICLIGALVNTLLFVCVSIPMAEGRQSRKDGFAEYKKQTRFLLPIYKKQK